MSATLIPPHGPEQKLLPRLADKGSMLELKEIAKSLRKIHITSRETNDLVMMGIGAFTPLAGFMNKDNWESVCSDMRLENGTFWPIPITMSVNRSDSENIKIGESISLINIDTKECVAIMIVSDKYEPDKKFECNSIFKTADRNHPGVKSVMAQKSVNLGGPVVVLSECNFPEKFPNIYMRPEESRAAFLEKGWKTIVALQLRNPMHRSHEYLAKIALELFDGLFIHQLLGELKPGDIPADVRVKCIKALVDGYFAPNTVIQGGYPLDMRYAGPREALLHAVFRQNFGCSHIIIGRDHAGVGDYYGPFDAQKIFDEVPDSDLLCRNINIGWTFYCLECKNMASSRTCPHSSEDHLLLSGTLVRDKLSSGSKINDNFSRPEVVNILTEYYNNKKS